MIRITKGTTPVFFFSTFVHAAIDGLRLSQAASVGRRRQSPIQFRFPHLAELKRALLIETHGKCVYCEQMLISPASMQVDHFRPKAGAVDTQGGRSDEHYYWLAYDWENMYASCPECNMAKGARFPVSNQRAPVGITTGLDAIESPLLLNPVRRDLDDHLQFQPDGMVHGMTIEGKHTIALLKLNRTDLVMRRADHARRHLDHPEQANQFLDEKVEFAGMHRQLAALSRDDGRLHTPSIIDWASSPQIAGNLAAATKEESEPAQETVDGEYYTSFPLISSIEIAGLFGFESLTLVVPPSAGGRPAWLALLGENGVGKSSVLKAIAIALHEGDLIADLELNVADLLNPGGGLGTIKLVFDSQESRLVKIYSGGAVVRTGHAATPILLLAYGATRLLPTPAHPHVAERVMTRARNLFDPYTPLCSPSAWLGTLTDEQFDFAAAAIKNLLNLPEYCFLRRTDSLGRQPG